MTLQTLVEELRTALKSAYGHDLDLAKLEVGFAADAAHGDIATNAALIIAKQVGSNPRQVAERLVGVFGQRLQGIATFAIAGPGFINLTLDNEALLDMAKGAAAAGSEVYAGQQVVTEYSDPNPFKALHVGHLYTTIVGDALSRLFEAGGATVHRLNYGGDVGLHVGRAMWGILHELGGEKPEKLASVPEAERAEWIGARYVEGTRAHEAGGATAEEVVACNRRVYHLHDQDDHESAFAQIYWTCREWSYNGFRDLYKRLGVVPFERVIPESEITPRGVELVRRAKDEGVLTNSDGAVVYKGEDVGLHTRVFITSAGLPTYEAKELGLAATKWESYHFDRSVIITGNDIIEYMKVILAVLGRIYPEVVPRTTHLTHGMVKLPGGVKMSSRKGNTLLAHDILDAAEAANQRLTGKKNDWRVVVSAVKYTFLKLRLGGDIVYDADESVSLEGNSGPYLQYAHARARSILAKVEGDWKPGEAVFDDDERVLVRKLAQYAQERAKAIAELAPQVIASYLYELSQQFNRFYEANRVVGDVRQATRLALVTQYADVLKDGLGLLGMEAPERL
jgi:arginyl-tRNA synthetase